MIDLSSLASLTSSLDSASNIILVNPQRNIGIKPQNNGQVLTKDEAQSFLFHYEGENSITLESDITDHFVEDNTAIQDQIALRPETISTHGFIGELNDVTPDALVPLRIAADKLSLLSPFAPALSATALIAYNTAKQLYDSSQQVASAVVTAWDSISGGTPVQNKQQIAFAKFYRFWLNRQLFNVQTPWAIFRDMAIKNLRAVQDEDTNSITSFEITFKRMRFAQTTSSMAAHMQGRAAAQAAGTVDQGVSTPIATTDVGGQMAAAGLR